MDIWKLIGSEPYTRKDGTHTTLNLWQRPCAKCGEPFVVKASFCATPEDKRFKTFGLIHCLSHRLTKEEVKNRWLKACRGRHG